MHEMSVQLPDPPDSLKGAPRVFYDELRQMLEAVQTAQLDAGKTSVAFDKKGLEIELVHSDRDDWGIWATVGEKDAIVGTSYAHEHFAPASQGTVEERPWTTEMVDFVAEVLRGEVEMQTTFRSHRLRERGSSQRPATLRLGTDPEGLCRPIARNRRSGQVSRGATGGRVGSRADVPEGDVASGEANGWLPNHIRVRDDPGRQTERSRRKG